MKNQKDLITFRTKDYIQIKVLDLYISQVEMIVNDTLIDLKNKNAFIQNITYFPSNVPNYWNIIIQYIIPIEIH